MNDHLKVLDVTEFYSERGGGVRSHLTSKAHELARRGIVHHIVAPGPRSEHVPLVGETRAAGSTLWRLSGPSLPYDSTYHLLWRIGELRAIVDRERPSVLEINSPYGAALGCLTVPRAWYGARTFFWHADFIDTYLRGALERLPAPAAHVASRQLWALVRRLASRCDATIATSRTQAAKLTAHGAPRVRCVPLGVDKHSFSIERRSAERRRELTGPAHASSALLVGVGRFAVEKRWDVVLDALALARARSTRRLVLALFGDGPERTRLERQARRLGDVHFMGFETSRARLASALASADLLVHGCAHETFGLSVSEAVASGLPIVVPDGGGALEVATGCARGPSAEIYRAGDARACADAILRLLERPLACVRDAALAAARRAPAMEDHFAAVLELYRELLARKSQERAA